MPSHFSRPVLMCSAALALLVGCAGQPRTTDLAKEVYDYRCAGDVKITVTYSGPANGLKGHAALDWDGQNFPLEHSVSGSGSQYSDGSLTLFSKGDEAFVEKDGEKLLTDCLSGPELLQRSQQPHN